MSELKVERYIREQWDRRIIFYFLSEQAKVEFKIVIEHQLATGEDCRRDLSRVIGRDIGSRGNWKLKWLMRIFVMT